MSNQLHHLLALSLAVAFILYPTGVKDVSFDLQRKNNECSPNFQLMTYLWKTKFLEKD